MSGRFTTYDPEMLSIEARNVYERIFRHLVAQGAFTRFQQTLELGIDFPGREQSVL
jgi:hypothetical protein